MIGSDSLVAEILDSKGKSMKFNACLATPEMMPKLVKLGRILGPKGLMPNPKVNGFEITADTWAHLSMHWVPVLKHNRKPACA